MAFITAMENKQNTMDSTWKGFHTVRKSWTEQCLIWAHCGITLRCKNHWSVNHFFNRCAGTTTLVLIQTFPFSSLVSEGRGRCRMEVDSTYSELILFKNCFPRFHSSLHSCTVPEGNSQRLQMTPRLATVF